MSAPRPAEAGRPPRGSRKVAKPHFLESGALRRGWMLIAQVVAVSAGVLIAWRAFGPVLIEVPPASVVTVREAAPPTTASTSSTRPAGMDAGIRAAARTAQCYPLHARLT